MTFIAKTGIGSRSPSFTPHTEKQLQSQRNEDSAPQELERCVWVLEDAEGRPVRSALRSERVRPNAAQATAGCRVVRYAPTADFSWLREPGAAL
jgi:hypothetical protein